MVSYATAHLDEIEVMADQRYRYQPVRHHLGITSFGNSVQVLGVNWSSQ